MAIISVKQEYESTEGKQDYKIELEIIYGRKEVPIDIRKFKDNYDKDEKSKCFNCNVYKHMAKDCWKPKKEKKLGDITNVTK